MKNRNASGTPFHCFDIHIPNHSPLATAAGIARASGVSNAISTTR